LPIHFIPIFTSKWQYSCKGWERPVIQLVDFYCIQTSCR
jgi:hypothetical protein